MGAQNLLNFGMADGLANLRNSIQGAMMSLVNANELGQTVQVNELLSHEVSAVINSMETGGLGNYQVLESVK